MVSTSLAEHGYISTYPPAERNQVNSIRHVSDSFIAADRRGIQTDIYRSLTFQPSASTTHKPPWDHQPASQHESYPKLPQPGLALERPANIPKEFFPSAPTKFNLPLEDLQATAQSLPAVLSTMD